MPVRFDDFLLDAASYSLEKGDEELRLEPRVFDLLVALVENRHRVVTKEELLDSVWKGQIVGDAALSRAVYELRGALGDDASRQAYVKTVHGRGYRFVAPVEEVAAPGAKVPASESPTTQTAPDKDARVRRGAWLAGGVAAALGAVLFLAVDAVPTATETSPEAPASSLEEVRRLAVLPLRAEPGDATAELTALSLTDQLWAHLGTVPGLVVRSPEYGRALSETTASIGELAEQAAVEAVLSGSFEEIPGMDRLRLRLVLHELTADGQVETLPIGQYEVPKIYGSADLDGFVRVRHAIAENVVGHVAPALAPGSVEGLAPHDPEAFRLYLLARERFATITCGDADALLELLDRSLALDPEFALAWVAKGFAAYSQVWSCGRDASFIEEAIVATDRALEIEEDLPLALFLKTLLLVEVGRAEDAYLLASRARSHHPRSPPILFAESYALRYAGHLDESERRLRETLALDPLFLREYSYAPVTLLYQGNTTEFLGWLPAAAVPHDHFYRGLAHVARGEVAEARAVLEPAFGLNPTDLFGRFSAALLAVLDEDPATAARIVEEIVRQRSALGTPDGEMTYKEAQLLALAGEPEAAAARLVRAVEQGFFCARCMADDPFLEPLRELPTFRRALDEASRRHESFGTRFDLPTDIERGAGVRLAGSAAGQ